MTTTMPYKVLSEIVDAIYHAGCDVDDMIIAHPHGTGYVLYAPGDDQMENGFTREDHLALMKAAAERGYVIGEPDPVDFADDFTSVYWPTVTVVGVPDDDS